MPWCCWCEYPHGPNHVCSSCQCSPKCQPPATPPHEVPSEAFDTPEDKVCTGWGQSPNTPSLPSYQQASHISRVKWNPEQLETISTGKFLLLPDGNVLYGSCENVLAHGILNLPVPKPLTTMFGRKILESMELNSNSANDLLLDLMTRTGISSGIMLYDGISCLFPPISEYVVTIRSSELEKTIWNQLQETASASSTGVQLIRGNHTEPLKKQGLDITLRILDLDFGTVIAVKETLSLMNLEVQSTFLTSSNGRIATRVLLKTKEGRSRTARQRFGLPVICVPAYGGLDLMRTPLLLSFDDV